jgi:hypothetical protein
MNKIYLSILVIAQIYTWSFKSTYDDKVIYLRRIRQELIITDNEIYLATDGEKLMPEAVDFIVDSTDNPNILKLTFPKPGTYTLIFIDNDVTFRQIIIMLVPLRNLNTTEDKRSSILISIAFFLTVIVIILVTVCILFNLKRIKKWWNHTDESRQYFPNHEELPGSGAKEYELS